LQYERDVNDSYKANVSLVKEMTNKQGINESISGYIVHVSLDSIFQITSISETKPYTEAP
jgi:ribosomal protein S17E